MPHSKAETEIALNTRAHDRIALRYERIHGEIYNDIEQHRLAEALVRAISLIANDHHPKVALDFGCGAGNLTTKLSSAGCSVIACDVSQAFLDLVASRQYPNVVTTFRLNGLDLSGIPDESVDMVATYSVLHHVPDYLGVINEFMRVLRPGGVVFIDHEASPEVWNPTPWRTAFLSEMSGSIGCRLCKYFKLNNYIDWFMRKFINPRYQREGDIHVWQDDHIEWRDVEIALMSSGAEVVVEHDYLLYRRGYDSVVYAKYAGKTTDMRNLVARKIGASIRANRRADEIGGGCNSGSEEH